MIDFDAILNLNTSTKEIIAKWQTKEIDAIRVSCLKQNKSISRIALRMQLIIIGLSISTSTNPLMNIIITEAIDNPTQNDGVAIFIPQPYVFV